MPGQLQPRLQELIDGLVADLAHLIRTATLDEVFGELSGFLPQKGQRPIGRAGDPSARIVNLLRSNPTGLRAEPIRKELGIEKPAFVRAINALMASGQVRKRGERRATTYYAGARKRSRSVATNDGSSTQARQFASRHGLTDRQADVLEHLLPGKSNDAIAKVMRLERKTVELYLSNIYKKVRVHSRSQLIARVLSEK